MSLDGAVALLRKEAALMIRPILMGIGNDLNGDDGVGPYIAKVLATRANNITVINAGTQPDNFIGKLASLSPSHVIFVDAALIEGEPGSIAPIPLESINEICFHTHYLPFGRIVQRIIDKCECKILVIGIRPASTEPGEGLSPAVKKSADLLVFELIELDSEIAVG